MSKFISILRVILYYELVTIRRKKNARASHSIGFMRYRFLLLKHSVVIYLKKNDFDEV